MDRVLPVRLAAHLIRLMKVYDRNGNESLRDIISASRVAIIEDSAYENWNGGMNGHDVILYLSLDQISKFDLDEISEISSKILADLQASGRSVSDEYYNAVFIEPENVSDPLYAKSAPLAEAPPPDPASVSFWKLGLARVFISHRDAHKSQARALGDELESYGLSCFVAHDTIKPMSEWRGEIMKGLQTMEVMLAYLTDDFEESPWTNQEVGFALGRSVPIISLKLGKKDPPGFISHVQAARSSGEEVYKDADKIFKLVGEALGNSERIQGAIVTAFCDSPNWNEARDRFDRMAGLVNKLSDEQIKQIVRAFRDNDQIRGSIYLCNHNNRLIRFMTNASGLQYEIEASDLRPVNTPKTRRVDDDIPF